MSIYAVFAGVLGASGEVPEDFGDPYFDYVELLMHNDGVNADTSIQYTDNSGNANTLTKQGTIGNYAYIVADSPYTIDPTLGWNADTSSGGVFKNISSYITVGSNTPGNFGGRDFTVELWAKFYQDTSESGIICKGTSGAGTWTLYQYPSRCLTWGVPFVSNDLTTGVVITVGQWHHIAVTRSSDNLQIFVDGIQRASLGSYGTSLGTAASPIFVGRAHGSVFGFSGVMSDVRILDGVAQYVNNFTPPTSRLGVVNNSSTTDLLINFNTGGQFDQSLSTRSFDLIASRISTSIKKFGTGSAGPGPGVTAMRLASWMAPSSPSNEITPDPEYWCFECWLYPLTADIVYPAIVWGTGAPTIVWGLGLSASTADLATFQCVLGADNSDRSSNAWQISTTALALETWSHVAWVRDGTTFRMYVNGTQVSYDQQPSVSLTAGPWEWLHTAVDSNGANFNAYVGYRDDTRFTNGVVRYSENFAKPALPFSNFLRTTSITAVSSSTGPNYSAGGSGSLYGGYTYTGTFDGAYPGSSAANRTTAAQGATVTFTFSPAIPVTRRVRIFGAGVTSGTPTPGVSLYFNGSDVYSTWYTSSGYTGANTWGTMFAGIGTMTSIGMNRTNSNINGFISSALEVDNILLLDNETQYTLTVNDTSIFTRGDWVAQTNGAANGVVISVNAEAGTILVGNTTGTWANGATIALSADQPNR